MTSPAPAFTVFHAEARSILSPTSGFLAEAGFSHSLTPARNCTFACTYCYVPTMRVQAGLKPEDWRRWGQFTTFKSNAADLLARELRPAQRIYCSPLVDPYQPAEASARLMPPILAALAERPPSVFVLQTRGPLIVRDLDLLKALAGRTRVRVSFSLTTNRDEVRRFFEPHCASLAARLEAIRALRAAGIPVFAALAPLLPCDPEELAAIALRETSGHVIADPLHVRASKPRGATTRPEAFAIARRRDFAHWLEPDFQNACLDRIRAAVEAAGRRFAAGTKGFSWLSQID